MTQLRIEAFNEANAPFYIVDHEDGKYSLCLPLGMLSSEYFPYCQEAFDAYAREMGKSPVDARGFFTYGNGYEWQAAFCHAFRDDPNLQKFYFDCEASGFFMDCTSLALLEEYGARFKRICEDTETFTPIVSAGIKEMDLWEAEQMRKSETLWGQLMTRPDCTFVVHTPYGNFHITPKMAQEMLSGEKQTVAIGDEEYSCQELLDQEIVGTQEDLFNHRLIRLCTIEPECGLRMV